MCKIACNSLNIDQRIIPILILVFALRPPIGVPNFSLIEARIVIAIYAKCAKRRTKRKKQKNFFKSLIAHILGMAKGIFFKFWMLPPLSGGHLHCKVGAIWIRNHGAIDAWKLRLCCSCQYTHSVCTCPIFLGCTVDSRLFFRDIYIPCYKVILQSEYYLDTSQPRKGSIIMQCFIQRKCDTFKSNLTWVRSLVMWSS